MVTMVYPILLDLYCCAGGAGRGYQRAGFRVYGVDIVPRPAYPGVFHLGDALLVLQSMIVNGRGRFWSGTQWLRPALIHTSPPCQERSTLTTGTNRSKGWGREHRQFVPETRDLLEEIGIPYVIEQPAGHGGLIRTDLRLCMDQFPVDPPRVWRHRDFELSGFRVDQPEHPKHQGRVRGWRHGQLYEGDYVAAYGNGGGKATVPEMQHALGIDWTDVREELTEAIPPAYTEHIGRAFLESVGTYGPAK